MALQTFQCKHITRRYKLHRNFHCVDARESCLNLGERSRGESNVQVAGRELSGVQVEESGLRCHAQVEGWKSCSSWSD